MIKIKLNTDVILDNKSGVDFIMPLDALNNKINKLKALIHYHRQEYLTLIDVNYSIGEDKAVYSEQFKCTFSKAEYEIFIPTNPQP